jgi:hypothetical protein
MIIISSLLDLTEVDGAENDVEKAFIIKLKEQFGHQFTSHLEGKKIFFLLCF